MSRSLRAAAATFAIALVVLVPMYMLLHPAGRSFSITRAELVHQAITAAVLALVLSIVGRRR